MWIHDQVVVLKYGAVFFEGSNTPCVVIIVDLDRIVLAAASSLLTLVLLFRVNIGSIMMLGFTY
jgi:hypothetical protein